MAQIKVMLVDDSAVVRRVGREILEREADIQVIAAVADPLFAFERLKSDWPDVLVIDIEMPRMDGLTFLKRIMAEHPTPTIVWSSLAEKCPNATIEAMAAGALAIITKPRIGAQQQLQDASNDLVCAVRAAARADMRHVHASKILAPHLRHKFSADAMLPAQQETGKQSGVAADKVIAIGTSTGGTQALEAVLTKLPATTTGIVVVQHMPEKFTTMFAERLDALCAIEVREAQDGDRVQTGRALIAPGGRHMMLKRSGMQYFVEVKDGPLVNRHKPSVDVLFRSVAQVAGRNALGIIMTGMGDDGARGLKEMHDAGAQTLAEDESSCVVFGMPKVAIELGGVGKILPLDRIPAEIVAYMK